MGLYCAWRSASACGHRSGTSTRVAGHLAPLLCSVQHEAVSAHSGNAFSVPVVFLPACSAAHAEPQCGLLSRQGLHATCIQSAPPLHAEVHSPRHKLCVTPQAGVSQTFLSKWIHCMSSLIVMVTTCYLSVPKVWAPLLQVGASMIEYMK